jgi:hypothetical protein
MMLGYRQVEYSLLVAFVVEQCECPGIEHRCHRARQIGPKVKVSQTLTSGPLPVCSPSDRIGAHIVKHNSEPVPSQCDLPHTRKNFSPLEASGCRRIDQPPRRRTQACDEVIDRPTSRNVGMSPMPGALAAAESQVRTGLELPVPREPLPEAKPYALVYSDEKAGLEGRKPSQGRRRSVTPAALDPNDSPPPRLGSTAEEPKAC